MIKNGHFLLSYAHLWMDVEVPVGLKAPLLALCIVEQEAVLDDEESLHR